MAGAGPLRHCFMLVTILSIFTPSFANAQSPLDFSALPVCAQSCTLLQQAQAACAPPAVPANDPAAFQACFCQSAYLQTLYTTPNGVCDAICAQQDLVAIQGWFTGLCQAGVTTAPTTLTTTSTPNPTPAAAGDDDDDDDDGDRAQRSDSSNDGGDWFSNHWRWVVMLIVIFLAMVGFSVLGVWLKRRHRRKRDLARANLAAPDAAIVPVPVPPTVPDRSGARTPASMREMVFGGPNRSTTAIPAPVVWGPHQSMAHLGAYGYPAPPGSPRPDGGEGSDASRRGSRAGIGTGHVNGNGKGRVE